MLYANLKKLNLHFLVFCCMIITMPWIYKAVFQIPTEFLHRSHYSISLQSHTGGKPHLSITGNKVSKALSDELIDQKKYTIYLVFSNLLLSSQFL